jgi:hypothetical protein
MEATIAILVTYVDLEPGKSVRAAFVETRYEMVVEVVKGISQNQIASRPPKLSSRPREIDLEAYTNFIIFHSERQTA